jgi:hypothetical protein
MAPERPTAEDHRVLLRHRAHVVSGRRRDAATLVVGPDGGRNRVPAGVALGFDADR